MVNGHHVAKVEGSRRGLTEAYEVELDDITSVTVNVTNGGDNSSPMGEATVLEVSRPDDSSEELIVRPPIRDEAALLAKVGQFASFAANSPV